MSTSNARSTLSSPHSENEKDDSLPLDLQVRFRRLEHSINHILDKIDIDIQVSPLKYKKLKMETQTEGLVFPAFNRVNESAGPIAEDKLFDMVSSYFIEHTTVHKLHYDPYPLIPHLKNAPENFEVKKFMEPVSDNDHYRTQLDQYFQQITSYVYDKIPGMEHEVFQNIHDALKRSGELVSAKSCELLLEYFTSRFRFDDVKDVCFIMQRRGFPFPIKTVNMLFFQCLKYSTEYSTNRFMFFWNLLLPYIQPDYFTLNVVASGMKKEDSFYRALRWIDRHNIPFLSYSKIERFIPGFYHMSYNRLSKIDISEEDRSVLANIILAKRINSSMSKANAFSEYETYASRTNLNPTGRTFHLIFDSIINDFNNFTFGVAFWNYFTRRYEATDAVKNIEEKEVCSSLLRALVDLGATVPPSESSNWSVTVRYIYMKTLDPETDKSSTEDSLLKKLDFIALKRKIFNFNIRNAPTLQESQTVKVQLRNLDWDDKPLWTFDDNKLIFRKSCYFFGFPYGLVDRKVAAFAKKENHVVTSVDAKQLIASIPSERDQVIIKEAIDDHKIELSLFDKWLENYFHSSEQRTDSIKKESHFGIE